jgi:hypothetical protein
MTAVENSTPASGTPEASPAPPPARRCENCGSPLYGDHCYACGQPTKGLVRHFSSILGDFFDTVFNIDSRVLRTLGPLLYRPGYLSLEYFAGRRVRYVTPMRLFLFLSLVAFFAVQLSIDFEPDADGKGGIRVGANQGDSFDRAGTVAEVEKARDAALVPLRKARKDVEGVPGGTVGMDIAIAEIQEKSAERIAELEAARKAGKPAPAPRDENDLNIKIFSDHPWHAEKNPVDVPWLPAAVDQSLNRRLKRAAETMKSDNGQQSIAKAMFNVLPQTLIVMMPIFALMLKLVYLFRRRLYMEHLIVALHSHAFIALAVTLVMLFSWLAGLVAAGGFLETVLNWARGLTIAWIPLYLLLMQKRIYMQGWPMTVAKYAVLGICYSILVGFAMVAAMIVGFLTL